MPDAVDSTGSTPLVLIAGGGPVGLALAALLAAHGVRSLVIEADAGYCQGSRAICLSRRSQEILGWVGADRALVAKGLPWVGGRSFHRDAEVLHFRMPSEPSERFAPMVNIQQFYAEQFLHEALQRQGSLGEVLWNTRVVRVRQTRDAVEVEVESVAEGSRRWLRGAWLVACDGGRSTVREQLGLQLQGMQYEGRYVIVDIEQATHRAVERLAWFDPPSNPGSTILMHRQPDDVWRIDYQIRDDEDPVEAVKPENVLPRVASHLRMIGETAPWKPLWISIYNAKCLTLDSYRQERVLFAGDAAHLVPIFGVRGLNSGFDDAANLAWKLALVVLGRSDANLLDSYSAERVQAARENIAYGAKSTEFMAPPDFGFALLREAALRLAREDERVRSLVNPRQSSPVRYVASPLNVSATTAPQGTGLQAGDPAPEGSVHSPDGTTHLSQQFGRGFVALYFSEAPGLPPPLAALAASVPAGPARLDAWRIARQGTPDPHTLIDRLGELSDRYTAVPGSLVLVRPDGYVLARWREPDWPAVAAALAPYGLPAPLSDSQHSAGAST